MKYALITLALLVAAITSGAQELDVFDLNDFVDPRLYGAVFDEEGHLTDPGQAYSVLRTTTGVISNYAWRNHPGDGEIGFFHLAKSSYRGVNQRNLKLTALGSDGSQTLPRFRAIAQIARYGVTPPSARTRKTGVDEPIAGRWLLSAMVESLREGERSYDAEIGGSVDVITPLTRGRSVAGSLVFASRKTDDAGWMHRAGYLYRLTDHAYLDNHITVGTTVAAGVERTDSWHWATFRVSARSSMDIGRMGRLNLVWTPTYLPMEKSRRLHHEIGFFIDRTLKVWLPGR